MEHTSRHEFLTLVLNLDLYCSHREVPLTYASAVTTWRIAITPNATNPQARGRFNGRTKNRMSPCIARRGQGSRPTTPTWAQHQDTVRPGAQGLRLLRRAQADSALAIQLNIGRFRERLYTPSLRAFVSWDTATTMTPRCVLEGGTIDGERCALDMVHHPSFVITFPSPVDPPPYTSLAVHL